MMDRSAWLSSMRRECEVQYDNVWAPQYGEGKVGLYSNLTHQQFLEEFNSWLPHNSTILDAACGAGRYLPFLLSKGHTVIGIDQSKGMISQAQAKFPAIQFERIGLQEMVFQALFDGAICMDAMENISPEDWPLVLANFYRALKPGGLLYFTAETIENSDEGEVRQAFERAQAAGLPVVYGECLDEGVYHYHPSNQEVRNWVQHTGFEILQDENGELWYYHILVRKG